MAITPRALRMAEKVSGEMDRIAEKYLDEVYVPKLLTYGPNPDEGKLTRGKDKPYKVEVLWYHTSLKCCEKASWVTVVALLGVDEVQEVRLQFSYPSIALVKGVGEHFHIARLSIEEEDGQKVYHV